MHSSTISVPHLVAIGGGLAGLTMSARCIVMTSTKVRSFQIHMSGFASTFARHTSRSEKCWHMSVERTTEMMICRICRGTHKHVSANAVSNINDLMTTSCEHEQRTTHSKLHMQQPSLYYCLQPYICSSSACHKHCAMRTSWYSSADNPSKRPSSLASRKA